jgi:magnesium-protoporphyrin O-methyltransferase
VTRRIVDIAEQPDQVEHADVVMLHRVVCCYPDYQRLLTAAGEHARRLVVFSHPPASWGVRALMGTENLMRRVRGNPFRSFVHPPRAMAAVVERQGLRLDYEHRSLSWNVLGFARPA